jgi:hypothetical protein
MRYPVVAAGFLALLVFYPLARMVFSWPVALMGTALLAVSRLEISYTRLVLPSITAMVVELTIFALALCAVRGRGGYAAYAAVGALLGLGLYSDPSFLLVPLLLALCWVGWVIGRRRDLVPLARAHLPGWVLALIVAELVALPLGSWAAQSPIAGGLSSLAPLLAGGNGIPDPGAVLRANLRAILGYWVGPGDGLAVNPPFTPMLDAVTAALFLLGLGYACLQWRRPAVLLILAWFGVTILSGALLGVTFDAARFPGYIPALFLLACLPLEVLWQALRAWRGRALPVGLAALLALLVGAGWINAKRFHQQAHDPNVRGAFAGQGVDVLAYFRDHGRDGYNYLLAPVAFPGAATADGWAAGQPAGRNAVDLADILPLHDALGSTPARVVAAEPYPVGEVARAFAHVYPGTRIATWSNADTAHVYSAAIVDPRVIAAQQGLAGPCPTPRPCASGAPRPPPAPAFWSGSLYIPISGIYSLRAVTPPGSALHATLSLEGRPMTRSLLLYRGWYSISVEAHGARPALAPALWWSSQGVSAAVPPSFVRRTPAYGLSLRFLTTAAQAPPLVDPQRVPFPAVLYPAGINGGRPPAGAPDAAYRVIAAAIVAPGHAGTSAVDLVADASLATVYLDGRRLASAGDRAGVSRRDTPFRLHLNGRAQVLQLEYSVAGPWPATTGAALYLVPRAGARTFLPWEWLRPPPVWAGAPVWLPQ